MNQPAIPPLLSNQGLKVRFSLNRWDLIQCRLWVVSYNRFLVLVSVAVCLVIPLTNLSDPQIWSRSVGFKIFYVVVLAGVMFVLMSMFQVAFQFVWMVVNKNRGVLGEHEIEIRDEGLVERTDVNESTHRWSGFHKIKRTSKFLFIFVTDNIVHYVPMRCFSSNEDARRFQEEIEKRWRSA